MAVSATKAASAFDRNNPDPHQLISLLMAGTLERVAQAKQCVVEGNDKEKYILVEKIIAIINGLRASLNFDQGGDIAVNLDSLYEYMLQRIYSAETVSDECEVLDEVAKLMAQVKSGWDETSPAKAA